MKGNEDRKADNGCDHFVPLAPQAVELLRVVRRLSGDLPILFPGERHAHRPMSENTLNVLLKRAGYHARHVPHGFRVAFSTVERTRRSRVARGRAQGRVAGSRNHRPDAGARPQGQGRGRLQPGGIRAVAARAGVRVGGHYRRRRGRARESSWAANPVGGHFSNRTAAEIRSGGLGTASHASGISRMKLTYYARYA